MTYGKWPEVAGAIHESEVLLKCYISLPGLIEVNRPFPEEHFELWDALFSKWSKYSMFEFCSVVSLLPLISRA